MYIGILALLACGGGNTESNVQTPGAEKSGKSKALETGAELLQSKSPLAAVNAYLDGFGILTRNAHCR